MKLANLISFIILAIGGLNWLSIGVFGFDFVGVLFGGQGAVISRIIFILVGIATLYLIYSLIAEQGKLEMDTNNSRYTHEHN